MKRNFKIGDRVVVRNAAAFVNVTAGDSGIITDIQMDGTHYVKISKDGNNIVIATKQTHKFERI